MYDGMEDVFLSTGGDGCLTGASTLGAVEGFVSEGAGSTGFGMEGGSFSTGGTSSVSAFGMSSCGSVGTANSDSSLP